MIATSLTKWIIKSEEFKRGDFGTDFLEHFSPDDYEED